MTVIAVSKTDAGTSGIRWEIPTEGMLNNSPIPRGVQIYGSNLAIPALGANDETNVNVTFTFPNSFWYLVKSLSIAFRSDDATTEFSNFGTMTYRPVGVGGTSIRRTYMLECDGITVLDATRSYQIYRPVGTYRHWVDGPGGTTITLNLVDMSGDTSAAGDVEWHAEFWEYDINQIAQWPVNTPIPNISY